MRTVIKKGITERFRKSPNESYWKLLFGSVPIPETTLEKSLVDYMRQVPVWRKNKAYYLRKALGDLFKVHIKDLTPKNVYDRLNAASKGARYRYLQNLGAFHSLMRFIAGDGIDKFKKPAAAPEGDTDIVGIKPLGIISEREARDLINSSRGKYSIFRENLAAELKNLPPGQSYPFEPRNLSKDPAERKKQIDKLKATIANMFSDMRLPFTRYYIPSKNIFLIMHKNGKPKKES